MAHYEGGVSRIAVETLTQLAVALQTNVEELIGTQAKHRAGKRGPAPRIQQQLERVSQLPRARQRMVSEVLDSLLTVQRRNFTHTTRPAAMRDLGFMGCQERQKARLDPELRWLI